MRLKTLLCCWLVFCLTVVCAATAQVSAPEPQTSVIIGTVIDVNNGTVPNATVVLAAPSTLDGRTVATSDNGFFRLDHLKPGVPYTITVRKSGFADWTSPAVVLKPGQLFDLTSIRLQIAGTVTTVTAALSNVELATEQERVEEQQRVLGFIPNFYVVYDRNAVPLTPKLKFRLAFKTETDAVTFLGVAFISGLDHAAATPDFGEGAEGYAKRLGANYANSFTDIMFAGAILPSVLHQDPRYFYQGTGTNKSRLLHALSTPFICTGDTDTYSQTIRVWVAIWSPAPSPILIIPYRIADRDSCFRLLLLTLGPMSPRLSYRNLCFASSHLQPRTGLSLERALTPRTESPLKMPLAFSAINCRATQL